MNGHRTGFDGATLSRRAGDDIAEFREHQALAPLYEWDGAWSSCTQKYPLTFGRCVKERCEKPAKERQQSQA